MTKKILIIGVPYSDNLGDYIIYDCIKQNLEKENNIINPLDFSGRDNFSPRKKTTSLKLLIISSNVKLLKWIVTPIYSIFVSIVNRKKFSKYISMTDYLIIGGGNIFSDNYLNFPIKIYFLFNLIKKHNKKYSVLCVGVGDNMSFLARYLYKKVLDSAESISVRDTMSNERLLHYFNYRKDRISIVPDPAITVSNFYPSIRNHHEKKIIGINVVDWESIFFGSDNKLNRINFNPLALYNNLAKFYINNDYQVEFFTNGAFEDNDFLEKLKSELDHYFNPEKLFFIKINKYQELINTISKYDKVISSRLHAIIIATSYNIPSVGFSWDSKVTSFYVELNSPENSIALNTITKKILDNLPYQIEDLFKDQKQIMPLNHKMQEKVSNYLSNI